MIFHTFSAKYSRSITILFTNRFAKWFIVKTWNMFKLSNGTTDNIVDANRLN